MESLRNHTLKKDYDGYLQVGVVTTTHGVRGELKVFPTTDDIKRFSQLKEVVMETKNGLRTLQVEGVKYFKQFAILKFKEFQTLNEVEEYKGCRLFVSRENAVKLGKDEYFIADLIGIQVTDPVRQLKGTLTDVLETGANDVYEVQLSDGRKILLPAIKDCIKNVDLEKKEMEIQLLKGILEEEDT